MNSREETEKTPPWHKNANPDCKKCKGHGWVCENHDDRYWEDCCGGAGKPCACLRDEVYQ